MFAVEPSSTGIVARVNTGCAESAGAGDAGVITTGDGGGMVGVPGVHAVERADGQRQPAHSSPPQNTATGTARPPSCL